VAIVEPRHNSTIISALAITPENQSMINYNHSLEIGMTNYRIDTHRHRIWPHRHGKTGVGVWKYSFTVWILGERSPVG